MTRTSKSPGMAVVNSYVRAFYSLLTEGKASVLDKNISYMSQLVNMFKADTDNQGIEQAFRMSDVYDELFNDLMNLFKELPEIFQNLIVLMHENRRLSLFSVVIERVYNMCLAVQGVRLVSVVSAQILDDKDLSKLKAQLEKAFDKKILIEWQQNKDLIAGFTLKIGAYVVDSSLKNRLQHLKNSIRGEAYA